MVEYVPFFKPFPSGFQDPDWLPSEEHENNDENQLSYSAGEQEEDGGDEFVMIMKEFIEYLTSIECGRKSLRDAKKHSSVVAGMLI